MPADLKTIGFGGAGEMERVCVGGPLGAPRPLVGVGGRSGDGPGSLGAGNASSDVRTRLKPLAIVANAPVIYRAKEAARTSGGSGTLEASPEPAPRPNPPKLPHSRSHLLLPPSTFPNITKNLTIRSPPTAFDFSRLDHAQFRGRWRHGMGGAMRGARRGGRRRPPLGVRLQFPGQLKPGGPQPCAINSRSSRC